MRKAKLRDGGCILLKNWSTDDTPRLQNLIALSSDGALRWRAELPDHHGRDCWVSMRVDGKEVIATTFSGIDVHLDPCTGEHLQVERRRAG